MGRKKKSEIVITGETGVKVETKPFLQPAATALQRLDEQQELRPIWPEAIDPMPDSKREHIEQVPDWPDFVENVRLNGVMVPIHLRKHPDQADRYMLIAGERRWRAAMACNLPLISSIIHVEMSALQAKELAILENYGRKDLTPIEESRCVSEMIHLHQGDLRAVAILFGKSEQWVRLRAKLQELSPSWLQGIGG
ncbi:MAG TPA: ParB/RepB/Spo0J family partition protein, partial [Phycisphaerae bacterium]|nr:ParB/RepB/Spo0J family partition protein [Phycisphaerae bacterium]